jgi:hypothetical protein
MSGGFLVKLYKNWRSRHGHPASFALHLVGIPACFVAAPILLIARQWLAAGVCFVAGYGLQFLGHFIEGSRSGEGLLLRRLLGRK